MPEQHQNSPSPLLPVLLGSLLSELQREGFREARTARSQLRIAEMLNRVGSEPLGATDLKYGLAALLCHSAEEQEKFYRVFEAIVLRQKTFLDDQIFLPPPLLEEKPKPIPEEPPSEIARITPPITPPPNRTETQVPNHAVADRRGPITIELRFRDDGFRPWNLPELEPALRPLREKEWAESEDWDLPASIRKIMRSGGVPHFVRRQKRRAPQYLFLIEQKSVRDHLAALYADLVQELVRRDVDAAFYFYDRTPHRCWKNRRAPSTHTTLDRIYAAHAHSRLVLIGEPDGLLADPRIYPSNLAFQLREDWRDVALLNTRSTALWGPAEETLCRLFPVAPASIEGLGSLMGQWQSRKSFTPLHWKLNCPEPIPTRLQNPADDPGWETKTIRNLKVYLGKFGFNWLCAISVYPEIYWQMTKILHDEAISKEDVKDETLRHRTWQSTLLQMSRLQWMRFGSIPPEFRKQFREMLPSENAIAVRQELRRILVDWEENAQVDKGSYAYQDRVYTLALLGHEEAVAKQPNLSASERAALEAEFRERLATEQVNLSDIADAVGREKFREINAR
ncbi:MAG: hypothetical protein ACKVUS_04215, partial [Saprospiraceae bacterium]